MIIYQLIINFVCKIHKLYDLKQKNGDIYSNLSDLKQKFIV